MTNYSLGPNINKWIIAIAARKTMRTFEHVKFNHVWSYKMKFNDRREKKSCMWNSASPLPCASMHQCHFRIAQMYRNRTRYNETNLLIQFRCWYCCCVRLSIFFLLVPFRRTYNMHFFLLLSFNYKLRLNNNETTKKIAHSSNIVRRIAHNVIHRCICFAQFVIAIATNAQTRCRSAYTNAHMLVCSVCVCVCVMNTSQPTLYARRHNKNASTKWKTNEKWKKWAGKNALKL